MPRSSSKLWPPRRAPRSVRSPMSTSKCCFPEYVTRRATDHNMPTAAGLPKRITIKAGQRFRFPCIRRTRFAGCSHLRQTSSDDGRCGVARLADAALGVHLREQDRSDDEEAHQRKEGRPVGVGQLVDQAEREGAHPAGPAFAGLVQAEVLRLAATGDQLAVKGT